MIGFCLGAAALSMFACVDSSQSVMAAEKDKVEITWWAFPTFTQEKAKDGVGTYEKKSSRLLKEKS